MNPWEHRLGPETAILVSVEEYQTLRFARHTSSSKSSSENGRVEQAEMTGYTKVHVEDARSIEMDRVFKSWLAFCVSHPTAPDAVELRICGHAESQT
jgi:hypothetical protein